MEPEIAIDACATRASRLQYLGCSCVWLTAAKSVVMIALGGRGQPPRLQFGHGMESCGRRPFVKGEDAGSGELSGPGRAGVWE